MRNLKPMLNNNVGHGTFTMSIANSLANQDATGFETFHTPSFGDEDFDIPPLALQSMNDPLSQHLYTTQPLSHLPTTSIANSNHNFTQPLSHPPTANRGCAIPQTLHHNLDPVIPKFPPQNIDIPDINFTNSILSGTGGPHVTFQFPAPFQTPSTTQQHHSGMTSQPPLSTISQSQLSSELGLNMNTPQGTVVRQGSGSPPGSNTTSPSRESSEESSDDSLPLAQLALKRTAPESAPPTNTNVVKKPKTPKKRKKKDPNEPQKPVSAYALFFRDTQAAIKGQNPNASFGEVSKIVASMWDSLDADSKNLYKKKTEAAKKEYLKQLAAYRASLVSKQSVEEHMDPYGGKNSPPMAAQKSYVPHTIAKPAVSMHSPTTTAPPLTHLPVTSAGMQQPMMAVHQSSVMGQLPHSQHLAQMGQCPPPTMTTSPQHSNMVHMGNQELSYASSMHEAAAAHLASPGPGLCIRNGCGNQAIENPGWDNEYCSNECVVSHCRDVFTAWVASRQGSNAYASVK